MQHLASKKLITTKIFLISVFILGNFCAITAQNFEGVLTYQVTYKPKSSKYKTFNLSKSKGNINQS